MRRSTCVLRPSPYDGCASTAAYLASSVRHISTAARDKRRKFSLSSPERCAEERTVAAHGQRSGHAALSMASTDKVSAMPKLPNRITFPGQYPPISFRSPVLESGSAPFYQPRG